MTRPGSARLMYIRKGCVAEQQGRESHLKGDVDSDADDAMSLTKSKGNMYPWVTHTHSHLAGECSHHCPYCYVQAMAKRFPNMEKRYSGSVRIIEDELKVKYGKGKTIFIEHMNDLFADAVPEDFCCWIMDHCLEWPDNTYVFQSKNPKRMKLFLDMHPLVKRIAGTTIETNRVSVEGFAPPPMLRAAAMVDLAGPKFVTIEPIIDFDVDVLGDWLLRIRPDFVNIGADSKGSELDEPPAEKILALIDRINKAGIEIREKHNLERLLS